MSESDEGGIYDARTDISGGNSDDGCEMATENPFSPLAEGGGTDGDIDASQSLLCGVQQTRTKRQRISTGGKSNETSTDTLNLDDKISLILSKMNDYDCKMAEINKKLDDSLRLKDKICELEDTVCLNIDRSTLLEYKTIDAEARSRRKNLIFGGFPEQVNENCALTIRQFLREQLQITDPIAIERSHRLGRFRRDGQRRIIVAFRDYPDTELILSKANLLKNTDYHINRDFPIEITNARKALWDEYKHLKSQSKSPKIVYPAKLMVGSRVVRDMFPQWNVIMRGSRVQTHDLHTQNHGFDKGNPQPALAPWSSDPNTKPAFPTRGEGYEQVVSTPDHTKLQNINSADSNLKPPAEGHQSASRQGHRYRSRSKQRSPQQQGRPRNSGRSRPVSNRRRLGTPKDKQRTADHSR